MYDVVYVVSTGVVVVVVVAVVVTLATPTEPYNCRNGSVSKQRGPVSACNAKR